MAADFLLQQTQIKTYIESHFPQYATDAGLKEPDGYVDDFTDFDKYTKPRLLFYDFSLYNFSDLSNESQQQTSEMSVYIALRSAPPKEMKTQLLKYAAAFYQMMEDGGNNFGGITDGGKIVSVQFYNAVEGAKDIKLAELTIELQSET